MGYGQYTLPDGREAGYMVQADCDYPGGCDQTLWRGLDALCGEMPDGHRHDDQPGCGKYFCGTHEADHDCSNPACGAYSVEDQYCGRLVGHAPPHVDAYDASTFTQTEEEYFAEYDTVQEGADA